MSKIDDAVSSNRYVEEQLDTLLKSIGDHFSSDILTLVSPMRQPVEEIVRDQVSGIAPRKNKLLVLLETDGGSIEVVERIADCLRYFYPDEVNYIIPNYAMSAGTVLAMSGDNIYMDYFSVLGPIDPQVKSRTKGDAYVPALGYLAKYDEMVKKSARGNLSPAEIAFFLQKFDPAELHQFEQARDLSIELLKKWLVQYKFKNWTVTRDRGIPVTLKMREDRAASIAKTLNDTRKWKSHGRGLSRFVLDKELNLIIEDFGADPVAEERVRSYYRLLQDYMVRVSQILVVHRPGNYLGV